MAEDSRFQWSPEVTRMPGIVGLISRMPREKAEPTLMRMVRSMLHESFYVEGTWIDEQIGVYVGWVARENSFADRMPVSNERGDITIVFSGEDYPEQSTLSRLNRWKYGGEGVGPAYLAEMYEQVPDFFAKLNGRFQGLVTDRRTGTATLFNDRYGLQRVYVHETDDTFYFSAEAKAILAVRPELRSLDAQGLGEFISIGCVLEGRSLFKGISALPPASAWTFRRGRLENKAAYFNPREWEEQEPLDADSYYDHLRDAFTTALPRYFQNGRERIGISLTGGLDTRIIMAWSKPTPDSLPCYTFGSMYRDNQDVQLARRVARICEQPYQVISVDQECLDRFPYYAERSIYLTDGCVDVSRAADVYNNQLARQIAPVRMVGTFGSEIVRGDVMYKHLNPQVEGYVPEVMAEVRRAGETFRAQASGHKTSFVAFRQPSSYHFGGLMLEQSQVTLRAPFLDNEVVRTVFRAPRAGADEDVRLRLIREGSEKLARLRTDRGLGDSNPISSFLQRKYFEFTFKAEYAYDAGMPQWVAKIDHAFSALHFERMWLGRHKLFHFRYWYRTILANYVREILLDSRSLARPYVKRDAVETIVCGHLKGNRNYTYEIHRLLSLELLHRVFIDERLPVFNLHDGLH
jgi:asparagine synthase (glutamine-hydrolysing)